MGEHLFLTIHLRKKRNTILKFSFFIQGQIRFTQDEAPDRRAYEKRMREHEQESNVRTLALETKMIIGVS